MSNLSFKDLIEIYSHIKFYDHGRRGDLHIASPETRNILEKIFSNADNIGPSGLVYFPDEDEDTFHEGETIKLEIGPPRTGLGHLALDLNSLIQNPNYKIFEPENYYLIEEKFGRAKNSDGIFFTKGIENENINKYRTILSVVEKIKECATFFDERVSEVIFVNDRRLSIKISYTTEDFKDIKEDELHEFLDVFQESLHKDQKLSILFSSMVRVALLENCSNKFVYILKNIKDITEEVKEGYKLFASSFSYEKIKNEIDNTKLEYIEKIQKTITDIQTQLLGIPISTVVVASQFKEVTKCGSDFWTNTAVLMGCWIFVIVLSVTLVNQWISLNELKEEIEIQKKRFDKNYREIMGDIGKTFTALFCRINKTRLSLIVIFLVTILGAVGATIAYCHITSVHFFKCTVYHVKIEEKKKKEKVSLASQAQYL